MKVIQMLTAGNLVSLLLESSMLQNPVLKACDGSVGKTTSVSPGYAETPVGTQDASRRQEE